MAWKKLTRDMRKRKAKIGDTPVICLIIDSDFYMMYRLLIQNEQSTNGEYKTWHDAKYPTIKLAQQMCDAVLEVQNEKGSNNV